jgi:hypothetical protein
MKKESIQNMVLKMNDEALQIFNLKVILQNQCENSHLVNYIL